MMIDSQEPHILWGETVNAAVYLHQRTPNEGLTNRDDRIGYHAPYPTPYEMLQAYGKPFHISKKHLRLGGLVASDWMGSVGAVRDTPVADDSAPGVNTTHRVAYRPPIAVSPSLLALSASYFKQTLWRCGKL
jgi:hypothetical protein